MAGEEATSIEELKSADVFQAAMEPDKAPDPEPTPGPPSQEPPASPPTAEVSSAGAGDEAGAKPPEGAKAPDSEHVPSWRLREEAERARAAEERARKAQSDLETLVQAIQAETQRSESADQKQALESDFFSDPRKSVETIVLEAVRPLAEHARQSQMALNRLMASHTHTEPVLSEAEAAFLKGVNDKTLDVMEYESVVQSPNRYDAVVKWHKRHKTMAAVGDDPAAYFDRQLEAKLNDPEFQAKLIEKIRGSTANAGSTVVRLPPSLSKQTSQAGASKEDQGSMDDGSLFRYARDK